MNLQRQNDKSQQWRWETIKADRDESANKKDEAEAETGLWQWKSTYVQYISVLDMDKHIRQIVFRRQ